MGLIRPFGFDAGALGRLSELLPGGEVEPGGPIDLGRPCPDDEVWVVGVDSARVFQDAVNAAPAAHGTKPPRAVLWVGGGEDPLPLDDWHEGFSAQIREENAGDRELLADLARDPGLLDWEERIGEVPAAWYAGLTESPRRLAARDLPFTPVEIEALVQNPTRFDRIRERLGRRAELYWAVACPSADEIAGWLEATGNDPPSNDGSGIAPLPRRW